MKHIPLLIILISILLSCEKNNPIIENPFIKEGFWGSVTYLPRENTQLISSFLNSDNTVVSIYTSPYSNSVFINKIDSDGTIVDKTTIELESQPSSCKATKQNDKIIIAVLSNYNEEGIRIFEIGKSLEIKQLINLDIPYNSFLGFDIQANEDRLVFTASIYDTLTRRSFIIYSDIDKNGELIDPVKLTNGGTYRLSSTCLYNNDLYISATQDIYKGNDKMRLIGISKNHEIITNLAFTNNVITVGEQIAIDDLAGITVSGKYAVDVDDDSLNTTYRYRPFIVQLSNDLQYKWGYQLTNYDSYISFQKSIIKESNEYLVGISNKLVSEIDRSDIYLTSIGPEGALGQTIQFSSGESDYFSDVLSYDSQHLLLSGNSNTFTRYRNTFHLKIPLEKLPIETEHFSLSKSNFQMENYQPTFEKGGSFEITSCSIPIRISNYSGLEIATDSIIYTSIFDLQK
ncbi:MAG: hypothetical protein PF541_05440 [Prolixibacteraceae bacterium]|jgi:hypothetical protein|nr:hypothetical protein [Prolixibacteraceae bacterium]